MDLSEILNEKKLGHGGWSKEDIYRQLGYGALQGIDWAQTRTIAKNPDRWKEIGPVTSRLLGDHPSVGQVNNYFLASTLANTLLAHQLPPEWRKIFQYLNIGYGAQNNLKNYKLGIGMTF